MERERVLLHACCGICSGQPIIQLEESGYDVTVYFSNNNLDTKEEYERRLEAEQELCKHLGKTLIAAPYESEKYHTYVHGLEDEPEGGKRCLKCFEYRLSDTALKAKELGIGTITTSMIISPHKNFKLLSEVGKEVGRKFGVEFLAIDFKKKDGFLKTNRLANGLGLYRQNYCGCEYAKSKMKGNTNGM